MNDTAKRICYHAGESFRDPQTGAIQLIKLTEDQPGYEIVDRYTSSALANAIERAAEKNNALGLTDEDVATIRSSSFAASATRHRFVVEVSGCSYQEAERVIIERIGYDEDYGFDYQIDWTTESAVTENIGERK